MDEKKKRVALVFFGLAVTVLIIEVFLRFLGWGFHYLQERENRESTLSKGIKLDQTADIQVNRSKGTEFVIVCIGESTTALSRESSWPKQLERILNNVQDEKTFRVINKGMPSRNTNVILEKLPIWLNEYSPDFVLAMVGVNDDFDDPSPQQTPMSEATEAAFSSHFRIYGLVEWIVGGLKVRITGKTEEAIAPNIAGGDDNSGEIAVYGLRNPNVSHLHPQTIRNLNDMVNITTENGTNFIFVQYALRKTDILKTIIEGNAIYISSYEIFLDLKKKYDYDKLFTDKFAGNFGHATAFGNRIIADNVAQQLLEFIEFQGQSN
jgi:hypothetical protein